MKLKARNLIDQLEIQKKKDLNSVFYYFDQMRDNLDQIYEKQGEFSEISPGIFPEIDEIDTSPHTNIEVFLDFDNLPLETKEYGLDFTFKVGIETISKVKNEFIATNFQGFFVPPKE